MKSQKIITSILFLIFPIIVSNYSNGLDKSTTDSVNLVNCEELELLSKLINSESGTENYLDKLMVGSVVLNRMRNNSKTMHEVIYAPNQFSGIFSKNFIVTEDSEIVARFLLENGPINDSVIYFINPKIATNLSWKEKVSKRPLIVRNTNHLFYK